MGDKGWTLWWAAREGDTDMVKQLLAEGVNPNARHWVSRATPLHAAASRGHVGVAELLLEAGARVDIADNDEATPLHEAASRGHVGVAELLLEAGARVDSTDRSGATPLYKAAEGGHVGVAELLLEAGARVESRDMALWMAAGQGDSDRVKQLLAEGVNPDADDSSRATPLHVAVSGGHVGVAELLLEAGARVDSWDEYGGTPLHRAASGGHVGVAELLIKAGARVDITDDSGATPLHKATSGGHVGVAELLQKAKAQLDSMDRGNIRETEDSSVPLEIQLRGPGMQQLYSQACRQGALPVHNTRGLVVGQYRSGKTCVVRRLTGENVVEDEPITDGIEISPSVMTTTWRKAKEELDEFKETMAERLAEQQEQNKSTIRTSSETQAVKQQSDSKISTDAGTKKAKEETGKQTSQTQQKEPLKEETPSQSQQTANMEDSKGQTQNQQTAKLEEIGRAESAGKDTSQQSQHRQRLQGDVTVQQQTQDIPDDVITKAKERLQGGVTEEQLGTAEHPRLSIWDFGGQATYYGSHQCFFTPRGIYILVMSLLQKLSDPVPDQDYKASADNLVTGRDYLDHWLNSVRTHGLVHGRKDKPPIVLVLTHKDMVTEAEIEEYKKDILDHISGMAAGKHVLPKIFVIDNFSEENSDIDELREYLREVAKSQWYMGQEVPITWLHLKSKLMDKRREVDPFCPFQDAVELARDVGITDDSHVADILTFLHDLGDIIFINEPVLRDHVALRPQMMIDVFKTIITVPEYQQDRSMGGEVAEMWRRLENEAILSDRLLTIIWTKADQKMQKPYLLRNKPFLKRLMEKYYLICNATPIGGFDDTTQRPEKEEIYFVPSLLAAKPDDTKLYPRHMSRFQYPLYVQFDNMFLPSGMFYRLQAICVRRFGFEESHVFAGCGRFPTDDAKQQFVVTKAKHYLKVELLSSEAEDQAVFTQGLPVRKFLSSCLFEIKEKWIPSIQYDWCFGEESDEETGKLSFHPLSDIGQETAMGSSRVPEDFNAVWMRGSGAQRMTLAENSGGDGPVVIKPTTSPADISAVHTIGPVLDCMETCRGLDLAKCDRIRHELTFVSRFRELFATVNNAGDKCRRLLGASVEVCLPERAPMFLREERGNDIVIIHVGDYNDKLIQPLLTQVVKSSSRYGVTFCEDVIKSGDDITDKILDHLLKRNTRMVVPIITPQALHSRHWSTLGYEFPVQNNNLVFPVFAYPEGTRERLLEVLGRRCAGMLDMPSTEVLMTEEPLSSTKISLTAAEILRKASSSIVLFTCYITSDGCKIEEDGVTISFPKGCVKTERFLSLEVDMLPIDAAMTNRFSAVTPVLTVHQDTEEDFLNPVTVTLPWTWKSASSPGRTILMRRSTGRQWSISRNEVRETVDTITFTTHHFCSVVGAKKKGSAEEASTSADTSTDKQDDSADEVATEDMQAVVTKYSEDKVHLVINPNEATTDARGIHLLCVEKGKEVTEYFRAANFRTPPPFQQEIIMHKKETILAQFNEKEDVIADPRDIPEDPGIQFVFPPANCNRISVRLQLRDPQKATGKKKFEGTVKFTLMSEEDKPVTDPFRRINSAHVYLSSLQGEKKTSQKRRGRQLSDSGPSSKLPKQVDVDNYFDKVVYGVSGNWDNLARKLNFTENQIDGIERKKPDTDRRCWEMLRRWRNRDGEAATLQVLKKALVKIQQRHLAETLEDSSESSDD